MILTKHMQHGESSFCGSCGKSEGCGSHSPNWGFGFDDLTKQPRAKVVLTRGSTGRVRRP